MGRLKHSSKWSLAALVVLVLCGAVVGLVPGYSDAVPIATTKATSSSVELATVSNGRVVVKLDQFPQGGNPGDPLLPYKLIRVVVAPDTDLETVSAELTSGDWEELAGEHEVAAAPPAATWNGEKYVIDWCGKDESNIIDGRDLAVYGNNAYFPAEAVEVVSVGQFRQWKVVEYRVWLAAYNPVSKKVRLLKNASAALSAQKLSAAFLDSEAHSAAGAAKFAAQLSAEVANPQDVPACSGPTEGAPGLITADYVIITTDTIVTNSTQLAAFIIAKQTAGYTVKTVTEAAAADDTHYISGGTCDQRANNIRAWLKSNYSSDGTEYVLLIGNPHPSSWSATTSIPMKMCYPRSGSASDVSAPSDMFFAELSNTWDLDIDGSYGEFIGDFGAGGADKQCEVKLGRIPFYGVYTDLDSILLRAIYYGSATGDLSWRKKVLIPAAISNWYPQDDSPYGSIDTSADVFGDTWGNAIKAQASSVGFSPYTLYEKSGVYGAGVGFPAASCSATLTNANVKSEWQNAYGFVTWWGHGSATGAYRRVWLNDSYGAAPDNITQFPVETSDIAFFASADCTSLDANSPSFVVQVSCNNAYPENSGNLGYSLLKNGAIATVSGTRVTWYADAVWNTTFGALWGDNASYGYYCFDEMAVSGSETIGGALVNCKSNFGTGWGSGSSWMNMVDMTLYGDPSLALGVGGNIKWEQKPDESKNGIDIRCDRSDGFARILADDYNCTRTGPITAVTFWGSWKDDDKGKIKKLHLSIHSDDPCGSSGHSEPNELLWQRNFSARDINETLYKQEGDPEWWWDPANSQDPIQACDYQIWQYDIVIDDSNQFVQQGDAANPVIYWLDIYVELDDYNYPETEFGWKTSFEHWNDDAVWSNDDGLTWNDLHYPQGHPYNPNTIDLSFMIITSAPEEEPNYAKPLAPHTKWSQPPIEINPPGQPTSDQLYAITFTTRQLLSINQSTGTGTLIGSTTTITPFGLSDRGTQLYAFDRLDSNSIIELDPANGNTLQKIAINPAGVTGEGAVAFRSDGIGYMGTALDPAGKLWSFDITVPSSTYIGGFQPSMDGMDFDGSDVLYGLKQGETHSGTDTYELYTINQTTAATTLVGDTGVTVIDGVAGLTFAPDGTLYAAMNGSLYTLNPLTGAATLVGAIGFSDISGLTTLDLDVATETSYPKYCGWDEESHNKDYNHDPCEWKIVADDFRCIGSMPVTSIHWWGSFYGWEWPGGPEQLPPVLPQKWWIAFWSNVPAFTPPEDLSYSHPDILLHEITIDASRVKWEIAGSDEYYGEHPTDICFQYYVDLRPEEVFWQDDFNETTVDDIYWISIVAEYNDLDQPSSYKWGWKTRLWHWMDDAVTFNLQSKPTEGTSIQEPEDIEPIKDMVWQESMDMAFELDTDPNYIKWEQLYTGIRHWRHYEDVNSMLDLRYPDKEQMVADDWRCLRRTPVTAVAWWGSYIGYGYQACSPNPTTLPVPPDRFELKVWTDVAADDPDNTYSYSHPGEKIWQYDAVEFDEVLVGYDKHPHGAPNEPVFRYSVRLPKEEWFNQPDYNEVFWLSVQAVYENEEPLYPWGWTNHEHVFNDNAVRRYEDAAAGDWVWEELYDQTGKSEDMSFILFTDPCECSTCANYNTDWIINCIDYADFADDWYWTGPAGGYNNSDLNCDGTADNNDLKIFALQWLTYCP